MEIRRVQDAKTQPAHQHDAPVADRIKQLQESFMKTTDNCLQVGAFYIQHIQPLFEQKKPYENLQQIDTRFTQITQLFKATKGIDADILEGYCHILTLYKFFACFQFFQIDQEPRSSPGSGATSPTSPASPTSPMSPKSPKSPKPGERKFSTGFTEIQSATVERNLLVYRSNLKKWSDTSFSFSEVEWKEKAHALNEAIRVYNLAFKAWSSSTSTSEEKRELDEIEILFQEEQNFAIFSEDLQKMTLEQKRLTEQCSQFEQTRDAAILSLEQNDVLHCDRLKAARIHLKFSSDEISQLGNIDEIQRIASFYGGKLRKCDSKKAEIKGLEESINTLQAQLNLLDKPFSQKNLLGKLLMRDRIFTLLREFKAVLEWMFSEYKRTLQEIQVKIGDFRKTLYDQQVAKIRDIKKNIKMCVREKLNGEIKSLQEEAILCREKERIKYAAQLKSQLMVVPMDDILSLNETHQKRENQLDSNWDLEIKKIIGEYRNNFLVITTDIAKIEDREKIQEKIKELDAFYRDVELRRFRIVSRGNELDCPRKDKIFKFFVYFDRLMQEIGSVMKLLEVKWVGKQMDFYSAKYQFFIKLKVDEKISELKKLLKEMQIFQEKYTANFDEYATKRLQTLMTNINSQLSYDSQKKEKNREQAQEYKTKLQLKISTSSGTGVNLLQEAKNEVADWKRREAHIVREDLRERESLEPRLRRIEAPLRCLEADIASCPVPEYSCFWATFWSIILPFFGCCIYQWWYHRKCRLAMELHMKRKLTRTTGSGSTSHEGSATSSPTAVSQTQDKEFTEAVTEHKIRLSSSGKMTHTMRRTAQTKAQQNDDYIEEPLEMHTADGLKSRNSKRTATVHALKRSTSEALHQTQRYQKTRQRLYDLTSPKVEDSSSPGNPEKRRPSTFSPLGNTSIIH